MKEVIISFFIVSVGIAIYYTGKNWPAPHVKTQCKVICPKNQKHYISDGNIIIKIDKQNCYLCNDGRIYRR